MREYEGARQLRFSFRVPFDCFNWMRFVAFVETLFARAAGRRVRPEHSCLLNGLQGQLTMIDAIGSTQLHNEDGKAPQCEDRVCQDPRRHLRAIHCRLCHNKDANGNLEGRENGRLRAGKRRVHTWYVRYFWVSGSQ